MTLKGIIKFMLNHTYRPLLLRYFESDRNWSYQGIRLKVKAGVFHPGLFFSTKLLIAHLDSLEIKGKSLLELGAGSGLISIVAGKRGARVTASDISKTAISGIRDNAAANQVKLTIIESDLFDDIPAQKFDIILINPPYYPNQPTKESEFAWFCGENFEYFNKLFSQIRPYIHPQGEVRMVLSDDCDLQRIRTIAQNYRFKMERVLERRILWEMNFIFRLNGLSE